MIFNITYCANFHSIQLPSDIDNMQFEIKSLLFTFIKKIHFGCRWLTLYSYIP